MAKVLKLAAKMDRIATVLSLALADLEDVREELAALGDTLEEELDDGLGFKE